MKVERIGVVGAGTMGAGIAQVAALGGFETRLHDPDPVALENGVDRVHRSLAKGAAKGLWGAHEADIAGTMVGAAGGLADFGECDLVVEAAPEDLKLKRQLFAALAFACEPGAILATNTSSLPVSAIAVGVRQPERVVGMHFFNPPALMKLVEVVATKRASPEALAATTAVARRMGRTPVRAKDSPGFIANRLARPFTLEALRMLAEGVAEVETIDRVCRLGGGFPMGPFELIDLIGLDVNLSVARSFYRQGGEPERWRPSEIQERLVEEGRLGRKSGCGFYRYGDNPSPTSTLPAPPYAKEGRGGGATTTLDPAALERIDPAAPAILSRLLAQIANEAAFALEEKIGSAADMDTAMLLGFNWPHGPIELTEMLGAERAAGILEELCERHGEAYRPAQALASGLRAGR